MGAGNFFPQGIDQYLMFYVEYPNYGEPNQDDDQDDDQDDLLWLWDRKLYNDILSVVEKYNLFPEKNKREAKMKILAESGEHRVATADNQWGLAVIVYVRSTAVEDRMEEWRDETEEVQRAKKQEIELDLWEEMERICNDLLRELYRAGYSLRFRAGFWSSVPYAPSAQANSVNDTLV